MKLSTVLAAKGSRVFTVRPEVTVREAVAELAANNVGALIICEKPGTPVGILSERDIIRRINLDNSALDAPISELMTSPVILGTSNDDLDSVLRTMTDRRFRHLPVVDGGELVGMVTIGDLVKAQLAEFRGAVETLETRLMDDSA